MLSKLADIYQRYRYAIIQEERTLHMTQQCEQCSAVFEGDDIRKIAFCSNECHRLFQDEQQLEFISQLEEEHEKAA